MSDHDDDETGFAAVAARFGAITPEPEDVAARRTPDPDLDPPEDDGLPQDGPPADPEAAERLARAARLALNDHGNGQRLTIHKGEDLMFVPRVGWHLWDGCRWAKDPDQLAVRGAAQGLADLITQEIPYLALEEWEQRLLAREAECAATLKALEATAPGDRSDEMETRRKEALVLMARIDGVKKGLRDRRGQHRRFATSAGNSNRITNALAEASVNLAVPLDALDARPLEVNCRNGVLVFETETIEVRGAPRKSARVTLVPHARAQRLSKMIACDHDPYAQAPRFQAFLEEVQPDIEMRLFLQRWFGLSMSAEPVQALAFFYGMGANGKSVLIDVIAGLLADYAATVRIESLTGTNRRGGGDATPDLIPLIGARFARTSEPDQGTRLQEGLIKELTGGEPILVRALHSDFIEIKPRFKLTMSGNHKPEIRGTDDGIWRRLMLVNWPVQIPADRRNPRLAAELAQEGPGILNWMIEGLLSVLENGLGPARRRARRDRGISPRKRPGGRVPDGVLCHLGRQRGCDFGGRSGACLHAASDRARRNPVEKQDRKPCLGRQGRALASPRDGAKFSEDKGIDQPVCWPPLHRRLQAPLRGRAQGPERPPLGRWSRLPGP
jgi:putative DNA primase/helicase